MRASFSIINKAIFKSPFNIIFGILVPIVISVIAMNLFSITENFSSEGIATNIQLISITSLIPTYSLNVVTAMTISILPIFIFTFRQSDIIQRLTFNSKNIVVSFIAIVIYFFVFSLLIYILSFGLFSAIAILIATITDKVSHTNNSFPNVCHSLRYIFAHANYLEVFYALSIYIILAISIGFLIGLYVRSYIAIVIISMSILLISYVCGGVIPLQMLCQAGQNGYDRDLNFWNFTYFYPLRPVMLPLIEAWTQGPVQNRGSLDWNAYIFLGFSEQIPWNLVNKFGYTSIFDIRHPFVTNFLQMPYLDFTPKNANYTFNTWYPDSDPNLKSWNSNIALWGALWMNIDIPTQFANFGMKSISVFTFANQTDKLLDIILPFIFILTIWSILFFNKYIHKEKKYENMK